MTLHPDYKRIIYLLIAGVLAASWIQINYSFEAGAIYIAMLIVAIFIYLIAEKLGVKK